MSYPNKMNENKKLNMTQNNMKEKNLWLQSVKKSFCSIFKKYVVISHAC